MQLEWCIDEIDGLPTLCYLIFSEKPSKADGSYQFDYVFRNDNPIGPFMIDATHPDTNEAASFVAEVVYHGLEINMDLFMKARGNVTGTVRDADGNPVPGASVLITPLGGVKLLTTADATGVFTFTNVRVGAFSLKAVSQPLLSEGTTMGMLGEDGGTITQDIVIYRLSEVQTGTVTGSVFEADGITPRPGVVVTIKESTRYENWVRTDADGIDDGWEVKYGRNLTLLDPTNADTDSDGILDGEEDPDADGLQNKWEYCLNLDPTNTKTDGTNLDANRDGDRDGWTNIYEVNTSHTNSCRADTDGDGVIDPDEGNVLGTDPNNKDDLHGTDFILSGGKTIRIEGRAYFNNFTITGNSIITTLTASTTQVSKMEIEVAGNLNIDEGSKIDVTARGYLGGYRDGNNSYNGCTIGNTTEGGSTSNNGGSYGGLGGIYSWGSVNAVYGDLMNPDEPGSGGGACSSSEYYGGGNGGGLIRIKAGTLHVDGGIIADGESSISSSGWSCSGGSGGGILIHAATLSGSGTISAKGGASSNVRRP